MANKVFANGMELACKSGQGKSICAFPDVCMTPPQTPATPPGVPIPYPNTGMATDTTKGSKSVKISGKEVMLKNKSYFKQSLGDEAGCAPKKGLITSKNKGKVYFNAWSMNVKFEGENVVRNLDITTHNHASPIPNSPPMPFLDGMTLPATDPVCQELSGMLAATVNEELPPSMRPSPTNPSTVAVGVTQQGVVAGASSISAKKTMKGGKYANYSKGIDRGAKSNVKTCGSSQPDYQYTDSGRPYEGHAEAKIIEDFFANGAQGTLVLKITQPPCPECSRLITEVNKGKDGKGKCDKIKVCE